MDDIKNLILDSIEECEEEEEQRLQKSLASDPQAIKEELMRGASIEAIDEAIRSQMHESLASINTIKGEELSIELVRGVASELQGDALGDSLKSGIENDLKSGIVREQNRASAIDAIEQNLEAIEDIRLGALDSTLGSLQSGVIKEEQRASLALDIKSLIVEEIADDIVEEVAKEIADEIALPTLSKGAPTLLATKEDAKAKKDIKKDTKLAEADEVIVDRVSDNHDFYDGLDLRDGFNFNESFTIAKGSKEMLDSIDMKPKDVIVNMQSRASRGSVANAPKEEAKKQIKEQKEEAKEQKPAQKSNIKLKARQAPSAKEEAKELAPPTPAAKEAKKEAKAEQKEEARAEQKEEAKGPDLPIELALSEIELLSRLKERCALASGLLAKDMAQDTKALDRKVEILEDFLSYELALIDARLRHLGKKS